MYLLRDDNPFERTYKLKKLFIEMNTSLSQDAELVFPKTSHLVYIAVDASLIGVDAILFKSTCSNKIQGISYYSRIRLLNSSLLAQNSK